MPEDRLTEAEFIARVQARIPELQQILSVESVRARVATAGLDGGGQICFTVNMPVLTDIIMAAITALGFGSEYRDTVKLLNEGKRRQVEGILGDLEIDLGG